MHLCLFEDRAELLEPLSLTRPVFDLLCGIDRLADKQRRAFAGAITSMGVLIRPHLEDLHRVLNPDLPINDREWLAGDDVLLVNGRWLPDVAMTTPQTPCVGMAQGQIAYVVLPRREAQAITFDALPDLLEHWRDTLPTVTTPTTVFVGTHDLLTPERQGRQIASLIPGAELRVFEDGGHLLMLERREQFGEILRSYTGPNQRTTSAP